jgi:3-methyladenine DNA glycosylase Mpg
VTSDGYKAGKIAVTPRIGITKSADMRLRYVIAESPFVSVRSRNQKP